MPLGASRISFLAKSQIVVAAEVIRKKVGVTAVGNAQIDTAQSKFGGSSALFDGTGDYLITRLPAAGTADWSIEFWFRAPNITNGQLLFDERPITSSGNPYRAIYIISGQLRYNVNNTDVITTSSISTDTWYHVAVTKSSGSTKMFLNGTQVGSTYSDSVNYLSTGQQTIGISAVSRSTSALNGWIDEFRASNNARYTANFTEPTAPFVNDANTLLLLHMDGTDGSTVFEDDNGVRSKLSVNAVGNTQVDTAQSKFGDASALFDGTGDYLTVKNNGELDFGTGDFTIEWWQYLTALDRFAIDMRSGSNGARVLIYSSPTDGSATNLRYFVNSADRISASNVISANVWQHIAVSRSGTSTKMFVNGTQVGSTYTDTTNYDNNDLLIWENSNNPGALNPPGYLEEFRISNSARYTANFTPATAPFQNDSNTLLLLHMDGTAGSTVFDDDNGVRAKVGVTAVANAQVDTAQSKFSGASLLLDGTDDYLTMSNSQTAISTGDFTVEGWFRLNSISASQILITVGTTNNFDHTIRVLLESDGDIQMSAYSTSTTLFTQTTTNQPVSTGTWYHYAVVRSGSNFNLYLDGTSVLSTTSSSTLFNGTTTLIGARLNSTATPGLFFNGHIDEVRISNSARYTANFTPATTPFQNDSNTLLLLHMDGTDASTYFPDDNGVQPDYDYGA